LPSPHLDAWGITGSFPVHFRNVLPITRRGQSLGGTQLRPIR
jgi:hypothetical protein